MSTQHLLATPPIADPQNPPGQPVATAVPPTPEQALAQDLMFLQEVLLEYEETLPDWRSSKANAALMIDVRQKLEASAAAATPPVFNEQELMFLQEVLIEYEKMHADWRRRLTDFNLMQTVTQAVSSETPGSPLPVSTTVPSEPGYVSGNLSVPPAPDPYYPMSS